MSVFIEENKERIKAIISALVVAAVNVAAIVGVDFGDGDEITNALLIIFDMLAVLWGCWKNHNLTDAAAEGQRVVNAIKSVKKDTGATVSAECALELTRGKDYDNE